MEHVCSKKTGSNPPVCGIHGVVLISCEGAIYTDAPYLGRMDCLKCPVSSLMVLSDFGYRIRVLAVQGELFPSVYDGSQEQFLRGIRGIPLMGLQPRVLSLKYSI